MSGSLTGMLTREEMTRRLLDAAVSDPRVVGLVDYGAAGEGRADEWSDVDAALFIRDADFGEFEREWKTWAAQFGRLLLAYVGGVGHPWAVYDARPLPLRVDFAFHRESALEVISTWPNSPASTADFVLHDATGGRLTTLAGRLTRQSLGPIDAARDFAAVCGDFWYYVLRTLARVRRGQLWAARFDFNFILTGNLLALLRLEAGALKRWRASSAAVNIERVISPERLARLDACVPGAGAVELQRGFDEAARLAFDACEATARANSWEWPRELAERVLEILEEDEPRSGLII